MNRVGYELRSTGVHPDAANPLRSGEHSRGHLPHVKREGARYFVTFRLHDSLPKDVLLKYQAEHAAALHRFHARKEAAEKAGQAPPTESELEDIGREYRREVERYLDTGCGECYLQRPEIADLVAGAVCFFQGQRYLLDAWVVMPNHVHVVFWPMPNFTVSEIAQSWKSFTARQANRLLNRTGQPFWQPEPFDHWIRNDEEHARCCRYTVNNPVTARLCASPEEWRWSSAWRGDAPWK